MTNRKEKFEEFLKGFQSLRRTMAFKPVGPQKMPRITPSQWGVLMLLQERDASVKDVAESLQVSSSAATQLVDGLVKSGYVQRDEHAEDRRAVALTLTKKTKEHIETMKSHASAKFLKMFEGLNDKEFNQYVALNRKIISTFLAGTSSQALKRRV